MKKIFFITALLLLEGITSASSINKPVSAQYGFIENKGQIIDQYNQLNPSVLFLYNGNGLHVQLKQNGFSYEVWKIASGSQPLALGKNQELNNQPPFAKSQHPTADSIFIHRIDISFVNANQNAKITSSDAAPDYINYYTTGTPEEGVTNVHHYKKVLFQNIYNNIDVEFVLNDIKQNGAFKYNFVVHPGGNPNDIQLKFDGATSTSLTNDGHITIETSYGNIDESIPLSYQMNENNIPQTIITNFKQQTSNCYGIAIGNYDATKTLIIDPFPWATYFGGSGSDIGTSISIDANGNVLLGGHTASATAIATSGAYQDTMKGSQDGFIAKLNSSCSIQWATYYGGSGQEWLYALSNDASNNIFVTGVTTSISSIATTGAYQTTFGGGTSPNLYDAFVVKFNTGGIRQWGSYLGGTGTDIAYGLAVDASGNVIITGSTNSTSAIASTGAYQSTYAGTGTFNWGDMFIVKFNSSGSRIWSTYFGGSDDDNGSAVTTDGSGNIYLIGMTKSTSGIATSGAYQSVHGGAGSEDVVLAKFSAGGSLLWSTYLGGSAADDGYGITVDNSGNVLITGYASSSSGIATNGAYQATIANPSTTDAFIAKFTSGGAMQWATYYGANRNENGYGIISDATGNIFVIGRTYSKTGMSTSGAYQALAADTLWGDAFIAKFMPTGSRVWSTYFGGPSNERGYGIALDYNGNVYVIGETASSSSVAKPGAYQTIYGGSFYDAFAAVFTNNGTLAPVYNNTITGNQSICPGGTPTVLIGSTPTGASGGYIYLWLSSTISPTYGFSLAVGTPNTQNYLSPALTSSTWYRRVVFSGSAYDSSAAALITVLPKPEAGFTVNNSFQCISGNNFIFNDTSVFSGTLTRKWNFGNGPLDTSSLSIYIKTYSAIGYYGVRLTVTGSNGCRDSLSETIGVGLKPNPGFTINNVSQCVNANSFVFNDTSTVTSGLLGRIWNFGNGVNDTSSLINPNKNYTSNGTFNVKLISNSYGCTDSIYQTIIVHPKPTLDFTINNSSQCLNGNYFSFNDSSSISSGSITRLWKLGNGDTSTVSNPSKSFSIANSYSVKLIEISNYGCKDSIIKTVNVFPKPFAGFSINNPTQCINGNSFSFNDTSFASTGTLTRLWNFGSGTNDLAAIVNPNKVYSSIGTFYVKLISSNNGCTDTIIKTVIVNPKPNVGFIINNSTQCLNGNNFLLNDTSILSSGTMTRIWNFGTGYSDTSSSLSPNKIYTNANNYLIKLVSSSNYGCKDSVIQTIIVNPKPNVGFTINNSSQCFSGNNFSFSDTSKISAGTLSRKWNFGNGDTSSMSNLSKTFATANSYSIKIISISNNGCKDSLTKTVNVYDKPNAGFAINNISQCVNANYFLFSDTSKISFGNLTSFWNFGNGILDTSSSIKPNKNYSTIGNYSIKLIANNNGCKDSVIQTVTVNPSPNVGFNQNNFGQCLSGNNFILLDTSTILSGTINRVWDFGDATNSSISIPNKSYSSSGNFQIKLLVTSSNNCKDSIIKTFTVYPQPKSGFTINNTSQCLMGNSFSFDDTTSTTATRLWNLGDLTTNTNDTFSKSYSSAGTFNVKLKVTDSHNCIDSTTKTLTVKPNPVQPTITALTKSLLQSSVANSYQWYLSSNAITGATSQTLALTSNGIYTVKIDSANGCSNLSNSYTTLSVGVNEINYLDEIKIYPNPATNELNIESRNSEKLNVQLFDVTGKSVTDHASGVTFINSTVINMQTFSEGIYFLRITDENNRIIKMQKIVVMK